MSHRKGDFLSQTHVTLLMATRNSESVAFTRQRSVNHRPESKEKLMKAFSVSLFSVLAGVLLLMHSVTWAKKEP